MRRNGLILLVLVVFAGVLWLSRGGGGGSGSGGGGGGGHAPKPALFSEGVVTLADGKQRAGPARMVLAMVTADWCPPCQELKRGALVDPRVEAWVKEHAVAVYIDSDVNRADAEALGASAIPTLVLLKGEKEVGSLVGEVSAGELLGWLEQSGNQR